VNSSEDGKEEETTESDENDEPSTARRKRYTEDMKITFLQSILLEEITLTKAKSLS